MFESGSNVRVIVTPGVDSECQTLAKNLSQGGSFWTVRDQPVQEGQLSLICAMKTDSYRAYVEDTGGAYNGQSLCSDFLSSGWSEDTSAENSASAAVSSAAAVQSAAADAAAAARKTSYDESTAQDAMTALQADPGKISNDLAAMDNDLNGANGDLATTRNDASQGVGSNCENLGTIESDASGTVVSDVTGTLESDAAGTIVSDISSIHDDLSSLDKAMHELSGDVGGTPPAGVDSARSAATTAINGAVSHANSDIDKGNAIIAAAYQAANAAIAKAPSDCGASSNDLGATPTADHISGN